MSVPMTQPNALAYLKPAQRTLEEEVSRLIGVHGKDAVKDAVKAATKPPRGRRAEGSDWKRLREWLEPDAIDWLEGRTPFKLRTNTRIAREFSHKYPGQSPDSTMRRIQRKLRAQRRWMLFAYAQHIAAERYPYSLHLKAMDELAAVDPNWTAIADSHHSILARYREVHGEPDPSMTWRELEARPRYVTAPTGPAKRKGGLLGMFAAGAASNEG